MNCEICKTPLVGTNLVYDQKLDKFFCQQCRLLLDTCYSCHNCISCDFETNSSPLPKQVQMTQRVGNTVVSQVIKNPERIKITCENGCLCWSSEYGCSREFCVQNRFCPSENWEFKKE